jgi:anaerobic selenocysteine-containing dehydrogenase
VEPAGESLPEWKMFGMLASKIEQRAKDREFTEYTDGTGREVSLANMHYTYTLGLETEEELVEEWLRDTALTGTVDEGTSLEKLREKGFVPITSLRGNSKHPTLTALNQASDLDADEPYVSLRWHTEDMLPYPTLTRRAQFYIDHEWFLEGGEELPVHKDNPKMGGDYPFEMTSGHNRWSIHSMNITNELMLETHRGKPHMVINDEDAERKGIRDDEEVRVFNDVGSFNVPVKIGPWVRPGQVIVYNGWDPYQFRGWKGPMDTEPGMVKWLHLAGGYGHLNYWPIQWQPTFFDRAVRVEYEKIEEVVS